jgi:hypothetical protein
MICAAAGMFVPFGEAAVAAASFTTDAALTIDAAPTALSIEAGDSAELELPPHAASESTEAASAARHRLVIKLIYFLDSLVRGARTVRRGSRGAA